MIVESELIPLNYDDILLLPTHSQINSRDDVNLYNKDEYIPIFSAPMLNISEPDVIIELGKLGGVGLLHRFFRNNKDRYKAIEKIGRYPYLYGIAIGINNLQNELSFVKFANTTSNCGFVVIDTASGYLQKTIDAVRELRAFRSIHKLDFKIIAGNVVDFDGCERLAEAGADIIRTMIGTGNQCLTSKSLSIGCPSLTVLNDCKDIKLTYPNVQILADGGISSPGNGLKALCFGADGIVIGSYFGRAKEAKNRGKIFGMSSYELQSKMGKTLKSNEGKVTKFPKSEIRPLKDIFSEFTYGLKSGMSYLGIDDINKIHDTKVRYIKVK